MSSARALGGLNIKDKLELKSFEYGPLISPSRDRNTPVYNWHAFKHSYSKELVKKLVHKFGLKTNSWVLDPFCGGGTTLLACKELGINSEGFDILPFSVFLSNVKTRDYKTDLIKKEFENFSEDKKSVLNNDDLPDIKIVHEAFNEGVKKELLLLRLGINSIQNQTVRDFYMLGLLSILEDVSNTEKSGGFLSIKEKNVGKNEVRERFLLKVLSMIKDVEEFNKELKFNHVKTSANLSDSRKLAPKRKFDAIITSPPYPNRHDYTRIYGLELIVGFIKDANELKQIRYQTIRSHVEAKKQFAAEDYKQPKIIGMLNKKIVKSGLNNPRVPAMLEGYFEDMYLSLSQMKKYLKKKGMLALVVSNVRFGGVNIPVDTILAEIGEQLGLKTQSIIVARKRGNSSQQMRRFKRAPSRESIIVWQNP